MAHFAGPVWWLAPLLGAAVVGLLYRAYGPTDDLEAIEEPIEA